MSSGGCTGIYEELGVRRVVNAVGNLTMLGGSIIQPKVLAAMEEANRYYVDMDELLETAGKVVAEITGAEAGYVTSGACAGLALGTAACMVGSDPEGIRGLPLASGVKNEVIIQKGQRHKYDRCITIPGAKLIEVGDETGTTPEQVEAAIGEQTAAIHYLARPTEPGVVPLEEVISIGKKHSVPVLVDAAGQTYPVEKLRKYAPMGADLVCYGGKYVWGPNSTGLLVGRKDLVEAAHLHSFIGFEKRFNRALGRPMKLDRQEVVSVVVALREWMKMDHKARFESYDKKVAYLTGELEGVAGIKITPFPEGEELASGVRITLDEEALGKIEAAVTSRVIGTGVTWVLGGGDPRIWVGYRGDTIRLSMVGLVEGDEQIIAKRLKSILA